MTNPSSDPSDRLIEFRGGKIDKQLAPFVADLINETGFEFFGIRVVEYPEDEKAMPSARFTFLEACDGSMFLAMLGTVWPEIQEKFHKCDEQEVQDEGWYIAPQLVEIKNHSPILECDEDCDDDCEHEAALEDFDEDLPPCDCDLWHVNIGVEIGIPLSSADEFSKRLLDHITVDEEKPDLRTEFEGIAGLDEFL